MKNMRTASYGSWKSPITAELVSQQSLVVNRPSQIVLDGTDVYWLEMRPAENGRTVIVRRSAEGRTADVTPAPFNVRTRVHEYGGAPFIVDRGTVYFSNFADQQLYRQRGLESPLPLTQAVDCRFADGAIDRVRDRIICVQEEHSGKEVINSIVSISLADGSIRQLARGNDFYSAPRLSPDGSRLVWLTWNFPNMPWDGNELWAARLGNDGSLSESRKVAGGPQESICQPEFSPDGELFFVSDRAGWWNLYHIVNGKTVNIYPMEAEFGAPQWSFGASRYSFQSASRILCTYLKDGISFLVAFDLATARTDIVSTAFTAIDYVKAQGSSAYLIAGSPLESMSVVRINLEAGGTEFLRRTTPNMEPGYISVPREIEFPTENGLTAHAFFYAPRNQDFAAPASGRPPLLVVSHGGPTSMTTNTLNLFTQFWTSHGFAVVDVNYGGSSGYGRAYRQRLNGQWGIVDVDDCINAARYLIENGEADSQRVAIRGGSAGGYTTLAALTFRHFFKAGASYYGVSDLEALDRETHKFESQYSHSLIGPLPRRHELNRERSPINAVDRLNSPIIFFPGAEDKIVPPDQSRLMADALRRRGLPVAYLLFEGEQHGFRSAAANRRALEAELYFYSKIFGFSPADKIEPVKIDNLK